MSESAQESIKESAQEKNQETSQELTQDIKEEINQDIKSELSEKLETTEEKLDTQNVDPKYSRRKNPPPPGMTLSAYKKLLRKQKFEEKKEEWVLKRKEKKKEKQAQKRKFREENPELAEQQREAAIQAAKNKRSKKQENVNVTVIIDCGFDEMMKDEEKTSLGSQLIRCYSDNKKAEKRVKLQISSFNKSLKTRFETVMHNQHLKWKNIDLIEDDFTTKATPEELKSNYVYLSSDSDNLIETLDENKTYIIGGIVDKGRYKDLCKNKAESHGIPTGRLPIDEFVKISGRRVLTTNHVFEILLQWLVSKNWQVAFETALPPRKLIKSNNQKEQNVNKTSSDESVDEEKKEDIKESEPTEPIESKESNDQIINNQDDLKT